MEWGSFGKGVVIPATQIEEISDLTELTISESDSFEVKNTIYFHIDSYHTYERDFDGEKGVVGCFVTLNSDSFYIEPSERGNNTPYLYVSVLIDEKVWLLEKSIKILQLGEYGEGGYWVDDSDWLEEVPKWDSDNEPIYIIKQAPSFRLINWVSNPFEVK